MSMAPLGSTTGAAASGAGAAPTTRGLRRACSLHCEGAFGCRRQDTNQEPAVAVAVVAGPFRFLDKLQQLRVVYQDICALFGGEEIHFKLSVLRALDNRNGWWTIDFLLDKI